MLPGSKAGAAAAVCKQGHLQWYSLHAYRRLNVLSSTPAFLRDSSNIPSMPGAKLVTLAREALRIQLRDAYIWRLIVQRFREVAEELGPKELSLLLNCVKQMKIRDEALFHDLQQTVLDRIDEYSIHDLSVVAASYAALDLCDAHFAIAIGDRVCEQAADDPPASYLSWVHLVGAFARAGVRHQVGWWPAISTRLSVGVDVRICSRRRRPPCRMHLPTFTSTCGAGSSQRQWRHTQGGMGSYGHGPAA